MSQHTPGPWTISKSPMEATFVMSQEGWVAQMSKLEQEQANARLIAKAPEMKDALFGLLLLAKHEVWCARNAQGDDECSCFVSKARALLREIEGDKT